MEGSNDYLASPYSRIFNLIKWTTIDQKFLLGGIVIHKVIVDIFTKDLLRKTFLFLYGSEQEAFLQLKLVEMVS